jgi:hypothetical protein
MLNNPNIPPYAHAAAVVNYLYAAKHGYAMIIPRCPVKSDLQDERRRPWMWGDGRDEYLFVWSKPSLIERYLPHFDFILFIDSDAVVVDDEQIVEAFIGRYFDTDTVLVWAEDCLNKDFCWKKNTGNAGVMVVKNTPAAYRLLHDWKTLRHCRKKWSSLYILSVPHL